MAVTNQLKCMVLPHVARLMWQTIRNICNLIAEVPVTTAEQNTFNPTKVSHFIAKYNEQN